MIKSKKIDLIVAFKIYRKYNEINKSKKIDLLIKKGGHLDEFH